MVSICLCPGLTSILFTWGFPIKLLYEVNINWRACAWRDTKLESTRVGAVTSQIFLWNKTLKALLYLYFTWSTTFWTHLHRIAKAIVCFDEIFLLSQDASAVWNIKVVNIIISYKCFKGIKLGERIAGISRFNYWSLSTNSNMCFVIWNLFRGRWNLEFLQNIPAHVLWNEKTKVF
jgi:hypothetical protein